MEWTNTPVGRCAEPAGELQRSRSRIACQSGSRSVCSSGTQQDAGDRRGSGIRSLLAIVLDPTALVGPRSPLALVNADLFTRWQSVGHVCNFSEPSVPS